MGCGRPLMSSCIPRTSARMGQKWVASKKGNEKYLLITRIYMISRFILQYTQDSIIVRRPKHNLIIIIIIIIIIITFFYSFIHSFIHSFFLSRENIKTIRQQQINFKIPVHNSFL